MTKRSPNADRAGGWVGELETAPAPPGSGRYTEVLRVPALSVGSFTASTGYSAVQQPHAEDEVYFVAAGRAVIDLDGAETAVSAGSVIYVPAGLQHQFTEVEELSVLVLFVPPLGRPDSSAR